MADPPLDASRFRNRFLLVLVLGISLLFFTMIRGFVITVLLAAVFTAVSRPIYLRLLRRFGDRRKLASVTTLLILLVVFVGPAIAFLGLVVSQAVEVSQAAGPWIRENADLIGLLRERAEAIPFVSDMLPERDQIAGTVGQLIQTTGGVLIENVRSATLGTANFLLQLFVMLYAMFFFLIDGEKVLGRILYLMPLSSKDEDRLLERFVSVTRATIKGSLVIGILQGALAGMSFFVFGIPGAAFWATVMAVLSIVPAIGAALIWVPAVAWLFVTGQFFAGVAIGVWCGAVVGTVDNFLRPRLIGRDTKMSDLLILLSTFGGIYVFGAIGFILGPVVAALFVTVWDLFAEAFKDVLPEVRLRPGEDVPEAVG